MAFITSPNMNLTIPTAGSESGPQYALDINNSLTFVDQHDHSTGKGVQIQPSGINITSALSMNNNQLVQIAGLNLYAQTVTPSVNTIYQSGVDLYFVDGIGNNIRLTQTGGVAGTPGSITNLVYPASVNYVAANSTYVFQSNLGVAGNIDAGSVLFRDVTPNSTYAVTLQPVVGLSSNYSLTLPQLPSVQSIMTLDNAGNITAPWTVDNSTIKIVSNQLIAQANVLSQYREHSWELNGTYSGLTSPLQNLDSIFIAPVNINIQSVWIYQGAPGTNTGGLTKSTYDLLVASPGGTFTSILSTTGQIFDGAAPVIWTDSGTVVPAQANIIKPVIATAAISAGQAIRFDLTFSQTGPVTDARIKIFYSLA